jgi:hypothetical protein
MSRRGERAREVMRDIRNRPNGVNGKIRRWVLCTAAGAAGVTTAALVAEFDILRGTAASHLRKLRVAGLIAEDGDRSPDNAVRSVLTDAGRAYLAANGVPVEQDEPPARFDDRALRAALGM